MITCFKTRVKLSLNFLTYCWQLLFNVLLYYTIFPEYQHQFLHLLHLLNFLWFIYM